MQDITRSYQFRSSEGLFLITAENSHEAIALFEKDHPEGWEEMWQADRATNGMTYEEYLRILRDENGWEKEMRADMKAGMTPIQYLKSAGK